MAAVASPPAVVGQDPSDFVHTGPGTLAGRHLRLFWQPVLRSEDLPPGRAKPSKILSEDFTLYRGESGAAHALALTRSYTVYGSQTMYTPASIGTRHQIDSRGPRS